MTAAFAPAPQMVFNPRPALALVAEPAATDALAHDEWEAPVYRLRTAAVYRRRRLVALAVVATIVGLALSVGSFMGSADATPTPGAEAHEALVVVVQPGDTLWGIARSLDPQGDPGDLAAALAEIAGSANLDVGQQIVVPSSLLG